MSIDLLRAVLAEASASGRGLVQGPEELVEYRRLMDQLEGQWLAGLHESVADGAIEAGSGLSATEWLADRCGRTHQDAASAIRLSTRLARTSMVQERLVDGRLSLGQAKVIASACTDRVADLFDDFEPHAVRSAGQLHTDDLAKVMRRWGRQADEETAKHDDRAVEAKRELFLSPVGDLEWAVNGTLTAEQGAVLNEALLAAMAQDYDGAEETRSLRQRRADGLAAVVGQWLAQHCTVRIHGARPQLIVTVTLADLLAGVDGPGGMTSSGMILDGATVERLACDCLLTRVLRLSSVDVEMSHATVEIPVALRRAVIVRDMHCRFGGCGRPAAWCEVHHIHERGRGGAHRLGNLVLLCGRHHHRIHRLGLRLELDPDGTLRVFDAQGGEQVSRPPPNGRLPLPEPVVADIPVDPALDRWRRSAIQREVANVAAAANLGEADFGVARLARQRAVSLVDAYRRVAA